VKIEAWFIGKTSPAYLQIGLDDFAGRIKKYVPFETVIIPDIKDAGSYAARDRLLKEGEKVLQKLIPQDYLILLDEGGKEFSSVQFSQFIEKELNKSYKKLIFLVGGSFGFSPELQQRANLKISLSKMTFSHQMVRLFFLEQIYRGFTILNNEPYHNA
jgi:23S rRNA (pseudouridine1915-N3)-methyltransferase